MFEINSINSRLAWRGLLAHTRGWKWKNPLKCVYISRNAVFVLCEASFIVCIGLHFPALNSLSICRFIRNGLVWSLLLLAKSDFHFRYGRSQASSCIYIKSHINWINIHIRGWSFLFIRSLALAFSFSPSFFLLSLWFSFSLSLAVPCVVSSCMIRGQHDKKHEFSNDFVLCTCCKWWNYVVFCVCVCVCSRKSFKCARVKGILQQQFLSCSQ